MARSGAAGARSERSFIGRVWNRRSDATARQALQDQLTEAQGQQAVRANAHRVMREDVFGVTGDVVNPKRRELRGRNRKILERRQDYFDARRDMASTPQPLDELHRQAMGVR